MNIMTSSDHSIDDISRITQAVREALTDQMIERAAITGSNAFELLDRLNDDKTNAAVHHLIDRLTEMHKIGAIDTVCDLILALHGARAALTDTIIERLFAFAENLLNTIAHDDVCGLVDSTCHALLDAAAESSKVPARGGLFATMALLSKPETQQSLQFLMNFAGKLQKRPNSC